MPDTLGFDRTALPPQFCNLDRLWHAMEARGLDGIIATNTTLARPGFFASVNEPGGLSGAPVRSRSTAIIAYVARATHGRLPIIGVGGIMNGGDAAARMAAGARLVQIYTGLVYGGPALIRDCAQAIKDKASC